MKTYAQRYEDFTKATTKLAEQIHIANRTKINTSYTLSQITIALRNIYKNPVFHNEFVGSLMSENKWSSGFCAMASITIYNIYGGSDIWEMMAIRPNEWKSPVIFLQDKTTGINFGTTGEHFYPDVIPYEIGRPLDVNKLKLTPVHERFKNILFTEMNRTSNM